MTDRFNPEMPERIYAEKSKENGYISKVWYDEGNAGETEYIRADLCPPQVDVEAIVTSCAEYAKRDWRDGAWGPNEGEIVVDVIRHLVSQGYLRQPVADWNQDIRTAPRYGKEFLLRKKGKNWVVEAAIFQDQEFMDGHPITEKYDYLHDMTNDKDLGDDWEDYEWQPLRPCHAQED